MTSWTEDNQLYLIYLYHLHLSPWRGLNSRAWEEMAREMCERKGMEVDGNDCREKIRGIMRQANREGKKNNVEIIMEEIRGVGVESRARGFRRKSSYGNKSPTAKNSAKETQEVASFDTSVDHNDLFPSKTFAPLGPISDEEEDEKTISRIHIARKEDQIEKEPPLHTTKVMGCCSHRLEEDISPSLIGIQNEVERGEDLIGMDISEVEDEGGETFETIQTDASTLDNVFSIDIAEDGAKKQSLGVVFDDTVTMSKDFEADYNFDKGNNMRDIEEKEENIHVVHKGMRESENLISIENDEVEVEHEDKDEHVGNEEKSRPDESIQINPAVELQSLQSKDKDQSTIDRSAENKEINHSKAFKTLPSPKLIPPLPPPPAATTIEWTKAMDNHLLQLRNSLLVKLPKTNNIILPTECWKTIAEDMKTTFQSDVFTYTRCQSRYYILYKGAVTEAENHLKQSLQKSFKESKKRKNPSTTTATTTTTATATTATTSPQVPMSNASGSNKSRKRQRVTNLNWNHIWTPKLDYYLMKYRREFLKEDGIICEGGNHKVAEKFNEMLPQLEFTKNTVKCRAQTLRSKISLKESDANPNGIGSNYWTLELEKLLYQQCKQLYRQWMNLKTVTEHEDLSD